MAAASDAARLFGLTPIVEQVMTESEFEPAFAPFEQAGVNAILVIANVFFVSYRDRLVDSPATSSVVSVLGVTLD